MSYIRHSHYTNVMFSKFLNKVTPQLACRTEIWVSLVSFKFDLFATVVIVVLCNQEPHLPTEISYTSIEIMTWICNYFIIKGWGIILHLCDNFKGIEVREWMSNYIQHKTMVMNIYTCPNVNWFLKITRSPGLILQHLIIPLDSHCVYHHCLMSNM